MKRAYGGLNFSLVFASTTSSILKGSVSSVSIAIDNVTVEDYKDGFESQGGFEEINFD